MGGILCVFSPYPVCVCYGFCKPTFIHVCILWLSTRFVKYVYLWIFTCWSINESKINEHSIFAEINHRLSIHNLRCVKWLYCSLFCASWAIYVFFSSLMSGHSLNFVTVLIEVFPNPYTAVILQNIVFISLTK